MFDARKLVVNEVGRILWISEPFHAHSEEHARELCDWMGWEYDREIVATVDAGPAVSAAADEYVKVRDREWLEGGAKRCSP
jgi:hypothetical protein